MPVLTYPDRPWRLKWLPIFGWSSMHPTGMLIKLILPKSSRSMPKRLLIWPIGWSTTSQKDWQCSLFHMPTSAGRVPQMIWKDSIISSATELGLLGSSQMRSPVCVLLALSFGGNKVRQIGDLSTFLLLAFMFSRCFTSFRSKPDYFYRKILA